MKKRGFTLIEILAVIIVLALIGLIAFPIVNGTIDSSREKSLKIQLEGIVSGAKAWSSDPENMDKLPENDGEFITVTLSELKQAGLVEQKIVNPKTNKEFPDTLQIKIIRDSEYNSYTYEIVESTISD